MAHQDIAHRTVLHPPREDKPETYLRQIRNMIGWLLVIVVLLIGSSIGVGIYQGVKIAQLQQGSGTTVSSSCQSQGGTVPGC